MDGITAWRKKENELNLPGIIRNAIGFNVQSTTDKKKTTEGVERVWKPERIL